MNEKPLYYRCEGTATEDFLELRANKKYDEILKKMSFVDDNGHPLALCEDFVDMCERWQKLEAAVSFRSFSTPPKPMEWIELKFVSSATYDPESVIQNVWSAPGMILRFREGRRMPIADASKNGFTGWRYPIQDVLDGEKLTIADGKAYYRQNEWRYPVGDLSE